jgi:GT2 family glycosyltransferase
MQSNTTIEVIIPVHNRRDITLHCLELLNQQRGVDFWVTVVDDGSSDGTSEAIQSFFPHVQLLRGDGSLWWAGATNLGIQVALSRSVPANYFLLLNDDVVFDSDYLASMHHAAVEHPDCLIGALSTYDFDPNRVYWCGSAASFRSCHFGYVQREGLSGCLPAETLPGRGMLVPHGVFERVGLLNARIFPQHRSDLDFSIRARKAGYGLLCCCDTTIVVMSECTGPGNVGRQQTYSAFLKSFWDFRSANYIPTAWRFYREHDGTRCLWRCVLEVSKRIGRETISRMGLINLLLPQQYRHLGKNGSMDSSKVI